MIETALKGVYLEAVFAEAIPDSGSQQL